MPSRPVVLLLYSGDDAEPYKRALDEIGLEARTFPVLEFEIVNRDMLRQALEHPNSYGGMIFSSPRSVESLADVMPWLPAENVRWHAKPVFAVGPRTADELRAIGFDPEGEESGSAAMLASYIIERRYEKPLLFLCGDRRRDELPDRLHESGVDFEELVVYASRPRGSESTELPDLSWVVLFSPSGLEVVERMPGSESGRYQIAAIGPTTATAAERRGFRVDAMADEPSPEGIVAAIRRAMQG